MYDFFTIRTKVIVETTAFDLDQLCRDHVRQGGSGIGEIYVNNFALFNAVSAARLDIERVQ